MSNEIEGLKELMDQVNSMKSLGDDIDFLMAQVSAECIKDVRDGSPVDTGTLRNSWEIESSNNISNGDTTDHVTVIWSNPDIISTNPKHSLENYEYYPYKIEYGFVKKDGSFYEGKFMLDKAMTIAQQNLFNEIDKLFNEKFEEG